MRTGLAALVLVAAASALLAGACGNPSTAPPRTIDVAGDRVTVASLVDAEAGLCAARASAATDPVAARATFYNRAHTPLHSGARALEDVDRAQAATLLEAMQKVESGLDSPTPSLPDDLAHLADVYRAGLGRLAISAPPCEK
ncbi:MAG: hypothetical protein M3066_21030 [Actinomycetota bacterium]|nr:hypothetical protein [Actinomycetota bacterium]